ncbi:winged helix DNA-binding protein [Dactylosporangium vinaceum]|uniref:MarR family winged helix-turn-helix transcriptional regulator n=1 Tax=Dactylosporangium vinaceum TaxID=53362 RepID=A0ABV5MMQ7_9ACTN|nr:MarR family transcriptional regulator [Dactylosporangium vinaceum]UAB92250.1 winged helix DNA-binding protein [Dactylosporangium vinaceum]
MRRSTRKAQTPDLGVLAARLLFGLQAELFARAAALGFDDVGPRHGAVLAYLDEEGIRLADLARLAGRNKQTIAAILDELEQLGYVHRTADPADRRAKLIRPTDRGRAIMRISDEIVADIEARHARRLGAGAYVAFVTALDMVSGGGSDRHAEHV